MPLEDAQLVAGGRVPQPRRVVPRRRSRSAPARHPAKTPPNRPAGVPLKDAQLVAGGRVPQPRRLSSQLPVSTCSPSGENATDKTWSRCAPQRRAARRRWPRPTAAPCRRCSRSAPARPLAKTPPTRHTLVCPNCGIVAERACRRSGLQAPERVSVLSMGRSPCPRRPQSPQLRAACGRDRSRTRLQTRRPAFASARCRENARCVMENEKARDQDKRGMAEGRSFLERRVTSKFLEEAARRRWPRPTAEAIEAPGLRHQD